MTAVRPEHFAWSLEDGVGVVTLTGAERKNPLLIRPPPASAR